MFNLFRKKSPEEKFRAKVRKGFDNTVSNTKSMLLNDPFADGLLIQNAISTYYQSMKNSPEIMMIGMIADNWTPEDVLEQECNRAHKKYLN